MEADCSPCMMGTFGNETAMQACFNCSEGQHASLSARVHGCMHAHVRAGVLFVGKSSDARSTSSASCKPSFFVEPTALFAELSPDQGYNESGLNITIVNTGLPSWHCREAITYL